MEDSNRNRVPKSKNRTSLSLESQEMLKRHHEVPSVPSAEEDNFLALQQDYERARYELIEKKASTLLKDAIELWLNNLNPQTAKNYRYYIKDMKNRGLFPDYDSAEKPCTVFAFNYTNHEEVIDWIKKMPDDVWKETTRQTHAACYISFTAFLERWSKGWFKKAIPNVSSQNKTFYQVHDKCVTTALTLGQWHRFISELHEINSRDSLIARCMFQGAKRVSEVLELRLEQIEWDKKLIRYRLSKTGGTLKHIPITYPQHFMDELKAYVEGTSEIASRFESDIKKRYVFVTRTGKNVTRLRLNYSFAKASIAANLPKVTPHMLRASWVTLVKQQGIQDTEIMKITGHTSSKMIYAYDKTSAEDNVSKKIAFI